MGKVNCEWEDMRAEMKWRMYERTEMCRHQLVAGQKQKEGDNSWVMITWLFGKARIKEKREIQG